MDSKTKIKKQQLLVEYLVSSVDTFALCKSIIKPEYFDPELRQAVAFINQYYDDYHATPTIDQIEAEANVQLKKHQITKDQIEYCADQVEHFCKRRAIEHAIVTAPQYISKGDYGKVETLIRDAISVSLNRDLGLSYFSDPLERLERLSLVPQRTPTSWKEFDDLLNGGLARKEILMVSANSGGGKSIFMTNIGLLLAEQKLNVLYLTLELSEELVAQRLDTMFTGISSVAWQQNYKNIASTVKQAGKGMGSITIKHMPPGTTSNKIRAYLKEFELVMGYVPDVLIVDYLDLMGANEKVSADNISEKDKQATEQLREILFDYNMYGITASQQNRSAIEATELNQSHIAGGLTKVNTVDVYASIIMTATMKAAGEIGVAFLKTRNSDGVGKTVYLRWDSKTLRIHNPVRHDVDEDGVIVDKITQLNTGTKKKSLLDIMNI